MSPTLLMAFLIQIAAVVVLRHRLGSRWLQRPVTILVITACVYNGISEALLAIPSVRAWDLYRIGTKQYYIDVATLVISVGLLAFVACYLAIKPERMSTNVPVNGPEVAARIVDWRLFSLASIPMAVLTYEGRGYNSANSTTEPVGISGNVSSEFLIVLISLAAFGVLVQYGIRLFVPVIVAQVVLLAATGERAPLLIGLIATLVLLSHVGLRPSRRQVGMIIGLSVVTMLGITGYRAVSGRGIYQQDTSLSARVESIRSGLYTLVHTSNADNTSPGLVAQFAGRLDGNVFAGDVIQSLDSGHVTLGAAPVWESALVVIPSAVWPSKLAHAEINPMLPELNAFGIQPGIGIWAGPIPTFSGLYIGDVGSYGDIAFMAFMGLLFGLGEIWLFRRFTAARIAMLAAAVQAALSYEAGLPAMLVALRTGIILAVAVWLIGVRQILTRSSTSCRDEYGTRWRRLSEVRSRRFDA
jgi:hypothetical protein